MSRAERQRLVWVDAVRVVDAALVVLVHADYLARPDPFTWWPAGIYSILAYGLCVPVFFALAGYVGARSSPRDLLQRAARLSPLVFAHGIVLLLLGVRDEATLGGQITALVMGVWYLYFIAALVQILLLHALVERFLQRRQGTALLVAIGATVVSYGASSANLWLRGSDLGVLEIRLRSLGTTWTAFYAMGVVAGRSPGLLAALIVKRWQLSLLAALFAIAFIGEVRAEDARYHHASTMQTLAGGLPFQLVGTLAVIALFARADSLPKAKRVLAAIGSAGPMTLSVYLLHGTFLWILYQRWIHSTPVVHPLEVPVLALLATGCAVLAHYAVRALPRPLPWVFAGVVIPSRRSRRPSP